MKIFKYEVIIRKSKITEKEVRKYIKKNIHFFNQGTRVKLIQQARDYFEKEYPDDYKSDYIRLYFLNELTKEFFTF